MLQYLRGKKKGLISWLIIGGIIITFTLWGYFSRNTGGKGVAATVNNQVIQMDTFEKEYKQDYRRYNTIFKGKFNEEMARLYNIKGMTLERLINSKVLVQTAQRNNILITEQDIASSIQNDSIFKNKEGQFDFDLYERILKANRYTPKKFEALVRERLFSERLQSIIKVGVKLSPEEILKQYVIENDKVSLSYIQLNPSKLRPKVNKADVIDLLKNETEKIAAYYKSHNSEFNQPEKVKARHILIKADRKKT